MNGATKSIKKDIQTENLYSESSNLNCDAIAIHEASSIKLEYEKIPAETLIAFKGKYKSQECSVCKKRFYYKSDLERHERIHTGERPYKCTICLKRFNNKSNLVKHIRTHSGEKPFKCNWCEKRFTKKSDLERHRRSHTGEKPHDCNICRKRFNQKSTLDKHRNSHTGEILNITFEN